MKLLNQNHSQTLFYLPIVYKLATTSGGLGQIYNKEWEKGDIRVIFLYKIKGCLQVHIWMLMTGTHLEEGWLTDAGWVTVVTQKTVKHSCLQAL